MQWYPRGSLAWRVSPGSTARLLLHGVTLRWAGWRVRPSGLGTSSGFVQPRGLESQSLVSIS